MAFVKYGDGQINAIIKSEEELSEEQKKNVKKFSQEKKEDKKDKE